MCKWSTPITPLTYALIISLSQLNYSVKNVNSTIQVFMLNHFFFFFRFLLFGLILGNLPKISFVLCLEVPLQIVWVGGWWVSTVFGVEC